ncbi:ion transporter [Gemmatimonadota bacterium]
MEILKKKVAFYLDDCSTTAGKIIEFSLLLVNLFACVLYVVKTYHEADKLHAVLQGLEIVIVSIFIVEYLLRFWISSHKYTYIFSFYAIVDLLSIMPIFFPAHATGFLRSFRVLRILRFLRFFEHEEFFFGRTSAFQLQVARVFFTIVTIIFIYSGFIYYAESGLVNPAVNTFADSVYFTIVTLTTVGFGDITPVTQLGKLFTVLMILSGIVLIPWQAGRLVRLLLSVEAHKKHVLCNTCGHAHHDPDAIHCKMCGSIIYQEPIE